MTDASRLIAAVAQIIQAAKVNALNAQYGEAVVKNEDYAVAVARAMVAEFALTREMIPQGATPGPWEVDMVPVPGKGIMRTIKSVRGPLAEVVGGPRLAAENAANARLIAHTPGFAIALSTLLDSTEPTP